VSVGVAVFEAGDASHMKWITRADRALYAAKGAGRNCTMRDAQAGAEA
jgi:GGDEF domain-containing protein